MPAGCLHPQCPPPSVTAAGGAGGGLPGARRLPAGHALLLPAPPPQLLAPAGQLPAAALAARGRRGGAGAQAEQRMAPFCQGRAGLHRQVRQAPTGGAGCSAPGAQSCPPCPSHLACGRTTVHHCRGHQGRLIAGAPHTSHHSIFGAAGASWCIRRARLSCRCRAYAQLQMPLVAAAVLAGVGFEVDQQRSGQLDIVSSAILKAKDGIWLTPVAA